MGAGWGKPTAEGRTKQHGQRGREDALVECNQQEQRPPGEAHADTKK